MLWAYAALRARDDACPWPWVGLCVLAAGMAPQVHYAGVALWPATLWLATRGRWWAPGRWRGLAAGGVVAVAGVAPWVWTMWPRRQELGIQLTQAGRTWAVDPTGGRQLVHMAIGAHWQVILAGDRLTWSWWQLLLQEMGVWIFGLCVIVGLAAVLASVITRKASVCPYHRYGDTLLLGWCLGAPLLFFVHSTTVYHHYMVNALPTLFLLCARPLYLLRHGAVRATYLIVLLLTGMLEGGLYVHTAGELARRGPGDEAIV